MNLDVLAIRLSKVIMAGGLALWALTVALNNLLDFDANWEFVQHVMAMDTVFPDSELTGRAITNSTVQKVAYISIIIVEGLTGLAFLVSAVLMAMKLWATKAAFQRANSSVIIGVALGFSLWFIGFMVVGGEWFTMWQSSDWNGQDAAFIFYMTLLAVGVFIFLETDGDVESGDSA